MRNRNAGLRLAVVTAARAFVDARPEGTRWTRENCRARYDAGLELERAVAALRAAELAQERGG